MGPSVSSRVETRCERWPIIRLLAVVVTMGLWAHWRFAWKPPAPSELRAAVVGMVAIFCFLAFISEVLARLYVAAVVFPVYATITLDAWLYDGFYWAFRTALRLLYMRRVSAVAALVGELSIFAGLWWLIEFLIRTYL